MSLKNNTSKYLSMSYEKSGNDGYIKHVGYYGQTNYVIDKLFSPHTIKIISQKITQLLAGVEPNNRPIVVPDKTINHVMSEVVDSYTPRTGDIYSRYNIPSGQTDDGFNEIINQTIEIITEAIKTDYGIRENNSKLTKWTTVLGNFNEHGIRAHPILKIKKKRPTPMQFNMNY